MSNKLKLSISGGEDDGKSFELDLFTSLLVGRSRKSAVRLHDADVSGRHFEFVRSPAGCCVKDLSRNGLKVDGRVAGEGEIVPIRVGSRIEVGADVKVTVEELPEVASGEAASGGAGEPAAPVGAGADFFADEAASNASTVVASADPSAATDDAKTDDGPQGNGEAATHGDFDDSLTEAGEGETQEMKTRVGSIEEMLLRKRQLDRVSVARRWKFTGVITAIMAALAVLWIIFGSYQRLGPADGPYLPNGDPDNFCYTVFNAAGREELMLIFSNNEAKRISVSADSNAVSVATFIGKNRDIPFHLEFLRWRDAATLKVSLQTVFERRVKAEAAAGAVFETPNGECPSTCFFEDVFPNHCYPTPRGVEFNRIAFARSVKQEPRRGYLLLMRKGDCLYQLRTEVPDVHWKRAAKRMAEDPSVGICWSFSADYWNSPGWSGLIDASFSDDYLLRYVTRELSAERISNWATLETYLDTLLVRSWGEKPSLQKAAMESYRLFLDGLNRYYNERQFAFLTASSNKEEKKMRSIFLDVKSVFGMMTRDRRSRLVNDPEVWPWP